MVRCDVTGVRGGCGDSGVVSCDITGGECGAYGVVGCDIIGEDVEAKGS